MEGIKNWDKMTWQEKREERFKRWLNPPDVKFVSKDAENLYKERVTRFIKAIKLEVPDRVPVMLPTGTFPAYWASVNFRTLMYDYNKASEIWIKYMEAFGDMDTFNGPGLVPSGKIEEAIPSRLQKLPGLGLSEDASMNQFVEGEYMMADEYDLFMMDPSDFYLRVFLPRISPSLEPFKRLPPIRSIMGLSVNATLISIVADPELRKLFQTAVSLIDEQNKHISAGMKLASYIKAHGYPSMFGFGPMVGPPFDRFADEMRGTHGIMLDMYRQPKKLHEAMESCLNLSIASINNYPMTDSPVCMMPLHKGDDTFMSDRQFEEFYWPYLRRVFLAMIDEGLVPMPFAEGCYTSRLKQITDTPRSGVVWYFDQTDMKEAKRIIGDICCIVGNVPTSIVMKGSVQQVKDICRQLIEDCAPGGGYILAGGASINNGKIENLKAMMDTAKEYGVYHL